MNKFWVLCLTFSEATLSLTLSISYKLHSLAIFSYFHSFVRAPSSFSKSNWWLLFLSSERFIDFTQIITSLTSLTWIDFFLLLWLRRKKLMPRNPDLKLQIKSKARFSCFSSLSALDKMLILILILSLGKPSFNLPRKKSGLVQTFWPPSPAPLSGPKWVFPSSSCQKGPKNIQKRPKSGLENPPPLYGLGQTFSEVN